MTSNFFSTASNGTSMPNPDIEIIETEPEIDSGLLRHDILASLRAIDSLVGFLNEDLQEDKHDRVPEHLERIIGSVGTARALVDGAGRFDRASTREPVEATSVSQLVRAVVADLEIDPGVTVSVDTSMMSEKVQLFLERRALATCIEEIVQNAVVHRPRSTGSVGIAVQSKGTNLFVTVTDDGGGIQEAHWDVVFEPLRKIHRHKSLTGIGLGLSIARKLADTRGGSVVIMRSSVTGSELQITWPITKVITIPTAQTTPNPTTRTPA